MEKLGGACTENNNLRFKKGEREKEKEEGLKKNKRKERKSKNKWPEETGR